MLNDRDRFHKFTARTYASKGAAAIRRNPKLTRPHPCLKTIHLNSSNLHLWLLYAGDVESRRLTSVHLSSSFEALVGLNKEIGSTNTAGRELTQTLLRAEPKEERRHKDILASVKIYIFEVYGSEVEKLRENFLKRERTEAKRFS